MEAAGLAARIHDVTPEQREAQMRHAMALVCGIASLDDFAKGVSEAFAGTFSYDDVVRVHEAWAGDEYQGVHDIVARLVEAGRVETGVLSNIDDLHLSRVGRRGAKGWPTPALLTHRVASCRVGLAKPMPGIYMHFEQITGCKSEEILFLEDSEENIRAARARGWNAQLIDWRCETAPQIEAILGSHGLI